MKLTGISQSYKHSVARRVYRIRLLRGGDRTSHIRMPCPTVRQVAQCKRSIFCRFPLYKRGGYYVSFLRFACVPFLHNLSYNLPPPQSASTGAEVFQCLQRVSHYSLASVEWFSIPRSIFTLQPLGTEEGPGQELSLLPQTLQVTCVAEWLSRSTEAQSWHVWLCTIFF